MSYMNFNTPYQNQSMYQPYQSMQSPQRSEIIRVNGSNGANAYPLAPNSSILLLDEQQPLVWLKQTDGAGYPTVIPYTITPYQPEPPVDMKSLEDRISKIEEVIKNGKSNFTSTKRNEKDTVTE